MSEEDADAVDAHGVGRRPAVQPQHEAQQRRGRGVAAAGAPRAERERLRVTAAHHHPRVVRPARLRRAGLA